MRPQIRRPLLITITLACLATTTAILLFGLHHTAHAQPRLLDKPIDKLTDRELEKLITDALHPLTNTAAVKPGEAVVVADPRGGFALFISPSGKSTELTFRLDRRTPALAIPPGGYALVRDIRNQLFLIQDSGKTTELFDE